MRKISSVAELPAATPLWTHALATQPSAVAHYNLGVALDRQGRQNEAIEHFRRALSIKPDFREAQRNLDLMLAGRGPAK